NDKALLEKEGRNLFRLIGNGQEIAAPQASIHQGAVEKSNINTVLEMTEMISLKRDYESQQKMIRTMDEVDDQAIRKVGSLTQ
ncbi:MAG: flagellar basal-body rod protein FlgF, partial [Desulfobulbaceae bacterium]|nr:flagellar basal-body rod protein FlgF [Desulfobulbaceae bacterium]